MKTVIILLIILLFPFVVYAVEYDIRESTVSAKQDWQETGIDVQVGQIVSITYLKGTWGVWGGPEGVKVQTDGTGFKGEYRDTIPLPDAPLGALIGRVGSGKPFFVGNELMFVAKQSGVLALRINDKWLDDNTGALTVQFVVAQSFAVCNTVTEIPNTECEALVTFYSSTDGDNWKKRTGWFTTNTPCGWNGVTCHDGHVIQLFLGNNQLRGNLPPGLSNLTELSDLDISSNRLSGPLPQTLPTLTKLTLFTFQDTNLCEPGDEAFQAWLKSIECYHSTNVICSLELFLKWLPVFIVMLGAITLLSGVTRGVYDSIKQIYGTEKRGMGILGKLTRVILVGGLFSILGGMSGLVGGNYGGAKTCFLVPGILVGAVIGALYSSKERTWKTRNIPVVFGILFGMTTGAFVVGLLSEQINSAPGRVVGAVGGGIAGFFGGLAVLLIITIVTRFISLITIPLLIVSSFKTMICGHCLHYTIPLKSQYKDGIRYCEHCQKSVERTHVAGKVIFTFGTFTLKLGNLEIQLANPNFELIKRPGRVFICSNPGFKSAERIVDVSEVYIDTNTCDPRLIERFMTYIAYNPLTYGLSSVHVFYRGDLDDLGEHLKNALQNNFIRIEEIP